MSMIAIHSNILHNSKNCILINRLGTWHIRRYPRDVKNGMSILEAVWKCGHRNYPEEFPDLF